MKTVSEFVLFRQSILVISEHACVHACMHACVHVHVCQYYILVKLNILAIELENLFAKFPIIISVRS